MMDADGATRVSDVEKLESALERVAVKGMHPLLKLPHLPRFMPCPCMHQLPVERCEHLDRGEGFV